MNKDISKLIRELDCNGLIDSQKNAIERLINIDDKYVTMLIQPLEKNYWENSAKVLKEIGYPRNKLAIPGLLNWLKDLNWPGAWTAIETLQNIDFSILLPYLEDTIKNAMDDNDELWIMALKELVVNRLMVKTTDFKNESLYTILIQSE